MPYMLVKEGDKICVYKHDENHQPVGKSHGCHDTHDEAVMQMRALYAAEGQKSAAIIDLLDNILSVGTAELAAKDPKVGGGVDRTKIPKSDFVFPEDAPDGGFPIVTQQDVMDAVHSWGRYKGPHSFEDFKKRLTAICKRKGFDLPASWQEESKKAEQLETLLMLGVKALYDANKSPYVWTGLSHNAWKDSADDTIPLALIENDINIQKSLIDKHVWEQFGYGLWEDHNKSRVIGDCKLREIVEGGRSCLEMGNLRPEAKDLDGAKMSIGYHYGLKGDEYDWILVYERSALKSTRPVNARTFLRVKRRELLSDAAIKSVSEELLTSIFGG